jgi:hypothetical protein
MARLCSPTPASMASSLAVPSPDVVRRATDKWVLAELAAGAGLQSPPTTVVERAEIAARASDLPTPAVIKPLRSKVAAAGGSPRGDGRRVESPSELPPRRCRASACSSSRTCRSARIDRRRGMAGGTGLREPQCAHILPPVCGVSAYAETIPRDRAAGGANREIAAVYRLERDLPGAVHSLRRQALPHRLEPRIVGSLALPVAAGLNLRAIWVDLLLGRRPGRQRRSRRTGSAARRRTPSRFSVPLPADSSARARRAHSTAANRARHSRSGAAGR